MDQNNLIARCEKLLHELGISKTSFCKHIDLSTSAYYAWKSDALKLSEETEERISRFLERFGFCGSRFYSKSTAPPVAL